MEGIELANLFYTLQLNSKQFDDAILQSGSHLKDFTKYALENPLAVGGALAASFIAVGVEAVKMADKVDVSMRRVVASIPDAQGKLDGLRKTIADLSSASPHSQSDLADAAAVIAQRGASSVEDIQARLRIAVQVADASGAQLSTVVEGLGSVMDAFRLDTDDGTKALTRLFAAAQGKVPIEDLFETLNKGASVLASLHVSAEDAGDALVALIAAGVPNRQAGTVLTSILALGDPANIQRLRQGTEAQQAAGKIIQSTLSASNISAVGFGRALDQLASGLEKVGVDTREFGITANVLNAIQRAGAAAANDHRTAEEKDADALDKLTAAARTNNESATALYGILKNNLSDVLQQLGITILPDATKALKAFDDILQQVVKHSDVGTKLQDSFSALQAAGDKITATRSSTIKSLFTDAGSIPLDQLQGIASALTAEQAKALNDALGTKPGSNGNDLMNVSDLLAGLKPLEVQYVRLATVAKAAQSAFEAANQAAGVATTGSATTTPPPSSGGLQLTAAQIDAIKQQLSSLKFSMQDAFASGSASPVDNARIQLEKFRQALDDIEKKVGKGSPLVSGAEDLYSQLANPKSGLVASAQAKVDADAQAQLDKLLADADSKVAAVKQLYDGLIKDFTEKKADPPIIAQLEKARDKAVAAAKAMDDVNSALSGVESNIQGREIGLATGTPIGDMSALLDQLDQQNAALKQSKEHSVEWNNILDEIKRTTADIKTLQDGVTKATQDTTAADQAAKTARAQYVDSLHNDFNEALQGAEQVANSFGKIDRNTQSVLNGINDWGNALSAFAKGDVIGGTIDALEGGVNVVKGALGLGGKSQAQKDAERMLDQNTQAILKLNEHIGQINNVTATGSELSVFQQVLNRTDITGGTKLHAQQQTYRIQDFLEANGLTIAQFRDFAASLGVNLSDAITGEEFKQLQDQAKKILPQAGQYADTFEGQMAALQQTIKVFDIEDPTKQLKAFGDALTKIKGGGGAITNLLNGFDLTTTAGVDAATQAVQAMFTRSQNSSLSTADLGGLSASDFQNALGQIADYLQSVKTGQTQASGTGGYNQQTTITDVTGMRLAALFSTGNVFAERTAQYTSVLPALAAILSGGNLPTISPPNIPAGGFGSTSTVTLSGNVGVTLTLVGGASGLSASDTAAIQDAVNAAVSQALRDPSNIRVISQGINSDNAWAARSSGELMQ